MSSVFCIQKPQYENRFYADIGMFLSPRKSQIALEYCFRQRHQSITHSVFWVNAATAARFEESFQSMVNVLGINDRKAAEQDNLMFVKGWLETELLNSWIMVIDNVDDETAFFREKCQNRKTPSQVIPRCPHGRLLFTSRTSDVAFDLASPATPICVDFLTTEEGLALLRKRLGRDPPEAHLIELLSELGHIPLAITQAISFIVKRRMSVEQYLKLYRTGDDSRSRLLSHQFLEHGRQEQTMESVARTWQVSFDWIQKQHPKAAEILCLMCFYQHHSVPEQLLCSDDIDTFEFEDSISALQAFSFLDMNKAGRVYSTHRLIQLATKLWLVQKGPAMLEKSALQALDLVATRFPGPDQDLAKDYWENCQTLLPHSDIVLQETFNINKRQSELVKSKLLIHTGRCLAFAEDNAADSVRRFERSHEIRVKYLGRKHPDTLKSMGFLFWSCVNFYHLLLPHYTRQGTRDLGRVLLDIRREVLGPRHPDTIDALSDFAHFLTRTGEYEEAETLQREALKLSTEVNGPLHSDTLNCMANLAILLDYVGRLEEALELLTEEMNIRTNLLGPESRVVLMRKGALALLLERLGRIDESLTMHRDLMTLKEQAFGPDHPETLHTARNLATGLMVDGRHVEALDVLGHVLSTIDFSRRNYGPYITEREFIELEKEIEHDFAAKRLAEIDIGSNHSEGSGAAHE